LSAQLRAPPRVGLGEDAGDRAAQYPDAHAGGNVDLDLFRATTFDTVPSTPPPSRSCRRAAAHDHRAVVLLFLLLRPDQQEVEHDNIRTSGRNWISAL